MELEVLSKSGTGTGRTIDLADDIFAIEPHEHAMWLSINSYLAAQRQGTAKTK